MTRHLKDKVEFATEDLLNGPFKDEGLGRFLVALLKIHPSSVCPRMHSEKLGSSSAAQPWEEARFFKRDESATQGTRPTDTSR